MFKPALKAIAILIALTALLPLQAQAQHLLYQKPKVKIVATTSQIADIIHNITGDHMQVTTLMGSGIDPHLYRPTRSDLFALKSADIIVYNGLNLEAQLQGVISKMAETKPVISVAKALNKKDLIFEEEETFDPHIWMNVNNWSRSIDPILETLQTFDERNAVAYGEAAKAYRKKLDKLDYNIQVAIATIPRDKRILITAHDAFGYLGQAYGMAVVGIQGLSTESEAGLQRIESIIDTIIKHDISAIFTESSVDDRNIEAIIEGVKARNHHTFIGGDLYSDAMGEKGSFADNYIGMMVHNVSIISEALGGSSKSLDSYRKDAILNQQ